MANSGTEKKLDLTSRCVHNTFPAAACTFLNSNKFIEYRQQIVQLCDSDYKRIRAESVSFHGTSFFH